MLSFEEAARGCKKEITYTKYDTCSECGGTGAEKGTHPENCPKCGGKLLIKKSKRGKTYYGCEHNPTCEFMTWDTPLTQECPKCGGLLLENKFRGKKRVYCADEKCGYEESKEKKSK